MHSVFVCSVWATLRHCDIYLAQSRGPHKTTNSRTNNKRRTKERSKNHTQNIQYTSDKLTRMSLYTYTVKPRIEAPGFYLYKRPWPPASNRDPACIRDSASIRTSGLDPRLFPPTRTPPLCHCLYRCSVLGISIGIFIQHRSFSVDAG